MNKVRVLLSSARQNLFTEGNFRTDAFVLLARLLGYCRRQWLLYTFALLFLTLYAVGKHKGASVNKMLKSTANIFIPYYTGQVVTTIFKSRQYSELMKFIGLVGGLSLAR